MPGVKRCAHVERDCSSSLRGNRAQPDGVALRVKKIKMGATQSDATSSPEPCPLPPPAPSPPRSPLPCDSPELGPDGRRVRSDTDNESSWRLEGQDPKYFVGICTVGEGTHVGMKLCIYEVPTKMYAVHGLPETRHNFYMHKESRVDFPLIEHWQTPRTQHGYPIADAIRLKEAKLFDGSLRCASCGEVPTLSMGTKWFRIDSTDDAEPSDTAKDRIGFLADKLERQKAQILCTKCEKIKTVQGSPYAQGTSRKRRKPI